MKQNQVNIKNRRAAFDYEITDTYTAGIVLTGTEIKSIRQNKASLVEIFELDRAGAEAGFTIVPLRLFINEKGLAKLVIGVARGKKVYDKRQSIREREDKRQLDRFFKNK